MSVVLDRPVTRTRLPQVDVPLQLKPRILVEPGYPRQVEIPVGSPSPAPKRIRSRSGAAAAQFVGVKVALFVVILGLTYIVSTLWGQYCLEKTRDRSNEASARAAYAIQAENEVQRQLDLLQSPAAIQEWAIRNSFRPTEGMVQTSKVNTLVASNP